MSNEVTGRLAAAGKLIGIDVPDHLSLMRRLNKDRVKTKERCVRIDYANDLDVDVVPALQNGDWIKIPSKRDKEWTSTNPAGFTKWCNEIEAESKQDFSRVAKIIKYWRDQNVGKGTATKSILLTTLIGKSYQDKASIAESLVETVKAMIADIEWLLMSLFNDDDVPYVENPSLSGENLARNRNNKRQHSFLIG
ncbi:SMODS domain-containing nucleotidyltransferase [Fictibacillus terranigra]|uniref:Death domain-containing protein n=1 Tax=Fictibacillus terranigra TaxID=3058424 RepID=A0ABT8E4X1_9BACL|nr:hypothetical protein [Fictibacillus sp. CENA-BCM004]MDN4072962.1 hypothetical protein [Fictibacillus sp. CENA-BCM004]